MGGVLPVGPWQTLAAEGAVGAVPLYIIPFDKNGVCTGPRTLEHLVTAARDATDVFLFSHGWNNDWQTATARYQDFITQFAAARRAHWDPPDRDYRPVLVGVFWPSTALVAPWEAAPQIAATATVSGSQQDVEEIGMIAERLDPSAAPRFYELAQASSLDTAGAAELAQLLAPLLAVTDDELEGDTEPPDPDDLLDTWTQLAATTSSEQPAGGFIEDDGVAPAAAAGLLGLLDPRQIVRAATVLLMKDRAGRVGGTGVADLLRRLVDTSPASRLHLIGHSYGGKVMLSALSNGPAPARPIDSVLLLQPAMSALCFATTVPGLGRPGGYRPALQRVRQPIATTYSRHDAPLTKLFHLAARRRSDLGEALIAGAPPSRYAALGGFGPVAAEADVVRVSAKQAPDRYDLARPGKRILAIQSDDAIKGHGDVVNAATAWALLCQVRG